MRHFTHQPATFNDSSVYHGQRMAENLARNSSDSGMGLMFEVAACVGAWVIAAKLSKRLLGRLNALYRNQKPDTPER